MRKESFRELFAAFKRNQRRQVIDSNHIEYGLLYRSESWSLEGSCLIVDWHWILWIESVAADIHHNIEVPWLLKKFLRDEWGNGRAQIDAIDKDVHIEDLL